MADVVYTRGIPEWAAFVSGTIKVMLVNASEVPDKDDDYVADVVANELTDGSYARQTLGTKTETVDDTNDRVAYDAADVTFSALAGGETINGAIVYREVTNDADSILMAFFDLVNVASTGADYVIQWNSTGLLVAQQG